MSDYKIKSIGKVDFRTYKDVVRVIAIKERGFWTSLFSSPKEAYFILSDESPLYGAVNAAKSNESIWDVSESSFTVERVNGTFYSVEKSIALYENKKSTSNPQPIGFSGILLAKRQNSFYCTYFLHNRNVADTKSPYPIKRLEVIRWFNQKSMVFNQSLS